MPVGIIKDLIAPTVYRSVRAGTAWPPRRALRDFRIVFAGGHARSERAEWFYVQLCRSGGARPGFASAAKDTGYRECRPCRARRRIREALRRADRRPSLPPEQLLRAALIQILFSIRSERQLRDQM